jgi:hypothetical protein
MRVRRGLTKSWDYRVILCRQKVLCLVSLNKVNEMLFQRNHVGEDARLDGQVVQKRQLSLHGIHAQEGRGYR